MTEPVIKVENLFKQYRLGSAQGYKTFRELIIETASAPFRYFGKLGMPSAGGNSQSGTIWALKNVSLDVRQGEVVGIIGRNGAGKSTLLKILSKITEPTGGRVELKGRVGSLLEVGTGFHPELTGHENIYLYGAILGMDRREVTRKFDEIVAFSELEKFIDTPVKRYSSGMYMRLAFAVAAHLEPEILLVDEVLAVGDMAFQKKCLGKMGSVSGEGRTVLFVSHNMAVIQGLCHKAVVFDGGEIAYAGETLQAIEYYTLNGNIYGDSKICLKNHPNRVSGCKPVLQEIEILSNGEASTHIGMGETLELLITFDSAEPVRSLGVAVEDTLGRRLFVVSPRYTNPSLLDRLAQSAKLKCTIPQLPLLPGLYHFTIGVTGFSGTQDKIEKAASISVSERDVFKNGGNSSKMKGVFFTHSDWRIENYN